MKNHFVLVITRTHANAGSFTIEVKAMYCYENEMENGCYVLEVVLVTVSGTGTGTSGRIPEIELSSTLNSKSISVTVASASISTNSDMCANEVPLENE